MRSTVYAAFAVLLCSGCACNRPSMGWSFNVGRPSQTTVPVLLQQSSGNLAAGNLGAGPMPYADSSSYLSPIAPEQPQLIRSRRRSSIITDGPSLIPSVDTCTLEEACRRIEALERRIEKNGSSLLPMPKGQAY